MNLDRIALPQRADEDAASIYGLLREGDQGVAAADEEPRGSAGLGFGSVGHPRWGQPSRRDFIGICPPFPGYVYGPLARAAIQGLKDFFLERGHRPSPAMWSALTAVAATMEAMADGRCLPALHLSSLDPGVGKTSVLIQFLKSLLRSEDHRDVAVLVCIQRLDQIGDVVEAAGLPQGAFAVDVGDAVTRQLSSTTPSEARVVFTTHARFERRCDGKAFADVASYHYRGRPRQVRVWDEAILPGLALTLRRLSIAPLAEAVGPRHPALAADLEQLGFDLRDVEDGHRVGLLDLEAKHGVGLNEVLGIFSDPSEARHRRSAETLWWLMGKTVTVRRDGRNGETLLDYRDTLPADLAPALVLDASVRVRGVYDEWERGRGGVIRLPSALKSYANLTLSVWARAGSKSAFSDPNKSPELVRGIVSTVLQRPNERWLIVHHKGARDALERALKRELSLADLANVSFLNWGRHDATNEFADVPNVILAGTLFYRPSQYEALGRLAAGRPSALGPYEEDAMGRIMVGEHCHQILQAASRGAVRRSVGDGCPEASVYFIAASGHGIREALPTIFPGASVAPWHPVQTKLAGKAAEAVEFIQNRLASAPDAMVSFADVQRRSAGETVRTSVSGSASTLPSANALPSWASARGHLVRGASAQWRSDDREQRLPGSSDKLSGTTLQSREE